MSPLRLPSVLALLFLLAPLATAQPGTLDPTFGTGGVRSVSGFASFTLAAQPDGTVLLGGTEANAQASVRRLRADGTPDPTFGTTGRALLPAQNALVSDLHVQPDGTVIATGSRELADGFTRRQFVARLAADGTLDAAFGTGGVRELSGISLFATAEVVGAADGGFLVAWSDVSDMERIRARRFRADGTQDMSFGESGTATFASDRLGFILVTEAIVDPVGRLLVIGSTDQDTGSGVFVLRLRADGTPDTSYGTDALAIETTPTGFAVGTAAVLSADGLVVTGYDSYNDGDPGGSGSAFLALRLTETGALDASFGTAGLVILRPGRDGGAYALAFDGDAIVLGGGYGEIGGGDDDGVLLRLLRDGSLDTSFGDGGYASLVAQGSANGLARLPDGRFMAAGFREEDSFVARVLGGTMVASESGATADRLGLVRTGPNPVRDRTTFRLTPATAGPVRVTVLDVRGRTVAVLHDGAAARPIDMTLDTSALASGVYHVRADGAGAASSLTVTVVR